MGFIYPTLPPLLMSYDPILLGGVALSILFLALLVWLMVRAASRPEWSEISQGTRKARDARERGA